MLNSARAIIDLSALRHNVGTVRQLCPHSQIMAMVKADAYGHGMLPIARALHDVDGFAVARLQEALQLRGAGIGQRLLLLGTLLDRHDLRLCSEHGIDVTAHDTTTVRRIEAVVGDAPLRVWLKLDSGMHRLGLSPDEFGTARARLQGLMGVEELIFMMHFSSADEPGAAATRAQLDVFAQVRGDAQNPVSVANSAALISLAQTRSEWVRPGIMLYGDNPLAASHAVALRPVMTLRARVLAERALGVGESVGYGATWTCARPSRIATIGIGYGDGYPRHAQTGTPVWVAGTLAPLVGRVSMDSIAVDVTDCASIEIGSEVELWGAQLPVALVAQHARTISYDLLTGVGARVAREYVETVT